MSSQDLQRDAAQVGSGAAEPRSAVDDAPADHDSLAGDAPAGDAPADHDAPAGDAPLEASVSRGARPARLLRRIALWTLAVLVTLALVASALVVRTVRRSFPEYGGTIAMPGLAAPVTVYRDAYGVPQVYASSKVDLFKAQGYVTAQDRFWEMDFRRHVTSGRLAELFGPSQVPTDVFVRTLGWRRVAEQEWRLISAETRSYLQAYADGVNAWIADNGGREASGAKSLEYVVLGLQNPSYTVQPWDPIDSLAWLKAMAWDLRGNVFDEFARTTLLANGLNRDQIGELFPPYPFARNRPIVGGGAVRNDAFDAEATSASVTTVPASYSGPGATVADRQWRAAAPELDALGDVVRFMPSLLGGPDRDIGSNSWVVSGLLTASGKPLLANDPHLSASMPGIWYQVGLHCSCPFNVVGFALSGIPGVIIGHNDRIAWGLTNLNPDVTDFYLEKVKGNQYFDGAGWRGLDTRTEVINVAGGTPVPITVRATKHGPLLSDRKADLLAIAQQPPVDPSGSPRQNLTPTPTPNLDVGAPGVPAQASATPYAVALSWTALTPGRAIDAIVGINQAANWTDFRAAAALFDVPAQNLIYADVDGNIGYQAPGRIPVRGKGDGTWPSPGWDPAYDWTGYIPFAELPNVLNPPQGLIVTANQAVIGPQYPYLITRDWSYGYRSQRIVDMLAERTARGKLGVEDMRQMQLDTYNGFAAVLVPALLAAAPRAGDADTTVAARDLLRDWNFQQPAESPARTSAAAAFFNVTLRHLMLRIFDELPVGLKADSMERLWEVLRSLLATPTSPWWDDQTTKNTESMNDILVAAMNDAVAELTDRLGDDPAEWRWGALHTLTVKNQTFGRSGIAPIERLFNRGPVPVAGGGGAVNATGWWLETGYEVSAVPTMRMIVDMSDLDGARWVQLSGNSGHAFHANYTDQIELWRTGQNTPMLWTRPRVQRAAQHTMTLKPANTG